MLKLDIFMVLLASIDALEFQIVKLSVQVPFVGLIIVHGEYRLKLHFISGVELTETAHLLIIDEHVHLEAADVCCLHFLPHNGLHSPVSLN